MKKAILLMFVLTLGAGAQDARAWLQKVFDVKYADPQGLARLVLSVMQDKETRVVENVALRAVSVGTRSPADMQAAEELVKRFDVPRSAAPAGNNNIEITFFILTAAHQGTAGDALPGDLDAVAKQLRHVFGYTDIRLLESGMVRVREGRLLDTNGGIKAPNPKYPDKDGSYTFRIAKATADGVDKARSIHLDSLRYTQRVPTLFGKDGRGEPIFSPSQVEIQTDLDVREGQKVVVGKAKAEGVDGAMFLVLTARVVD